MNTRIQQRKLVLLVLFLGSVVIAFLAWNGFGVFSEQEILTIRTHLIFRNVCHQIPNRSFILDGSQLPVCGRCLGIYTAIPLGIMILGAGSGLKKRNSRDEVVKMVMIVSLFLILEVILEMFDIIHVGNEFRFMTGFIYISSVSLLINSIKFSRHE